MHDALRSDVAVTTRRHLSVPVIIIIIIINVIIWSKVRAIGYIWSLQKLHRNTNELQTDVIKLAASSGKRNASVWPASVCLSHLFLTLIGRATHTQRDAATRPAYISVRMLAGRSTCF